MAQDDDDIFSIGDLVRCIYDLFETHEYILIPEITDGRVHHGIIIGLQYNALGTDNIYNEQLETIYAVRCFDNEVRFFSFWEMKLLSSCK